MLTRGVSIFYLNKRHLKNRLDTISGIIQNNTATAEERISIREELSAQAGMLYAEITKYRI